MFSSRSRGVALRFLMRRGGKRQVLKIARGTACLFFDFFAGRWYNKNMERATDNLILIGMPACGKSTAGVLAAKTLGYGFIDSDLVIQTQEKKLLSEIIEERGMEGFIDVENRVNAAIWAERCVIATGGSVIYGAEAMEHLKSIGSVIYLKVSFEEIERRLGNIILGRGVVIRRGESLRDLYDERVPLYEKYADYTIDCDAHGVEETVHAICALAEKIGDKRE